MDGLNTTKYVSIGSSILVKQERLLILPTYLCGWHKGNLPRSNCILCLWRSPKILPFVKLLLNFYNHINYYEQQFDIIQVKLTYVRNSCSC